MNKRLTKYLDDLYGITVMVFVILVMVAALTYLVTIPLNWYIGYVTNKTIAGDYIYRCIPYGSHEYVTVPKEDVIKVNYFYSPVSIEGKTHYYINCSKINQ